MHLYRFFSEAVMRLLCIIQGRYAVHTEARALNRLLLALNAHSASCAENFISRSNKFPGDGLTPLRAEIYVAWIFFPLSYADFLSAGIQLELRGPQAQGGFGDRQESKIAEVGSRL